MTTLPLPIDAVTAPEWFSASRLGQAVECPLSLALSDRKADVDPLPSHPRATYGSLLHRVYEAAARGEVPPGPDLPTDLYTLIESAVGELPADVPSPDIVYGYQDWTERTSNVVSRAGRLAESADPAHVYAPSTHVGKSDGTWTPRFATSANKRWSEESLQSRTLRVRGQADLIEREGSHVVVTDLKTGRGAVGPDGVSANAALQLRAYGLIVLEHLPNAAVELAVDSGHATPVSFSASDQAETKSALAVLADRLPPGETLDAKALASPGPACRYCNHRHRCDAYLRTAPTWWTEGAEHAFPLDAWGHVETVTPVRDGATVTLRDAANRAVTLSRLRGADDLVVGDELYAFGLQGRLGRTEDGHATAPSRYHDHDPNGGGRAWALALFRADARPALANG